ncbi:sensor histidine kinase [Saccharicrinis sp. FJH2]|uniref:sensor histidine kinase n=1 Tax=Saccharicrinis sp. FJH65 TaxID=3344659 RepID=UPI0035F385FE
MVGSLGVVLLIVLSILFVNKRINRRRIKLSGLNTKVRELELAAIRAQMNPHFMYNCLNSIQNLVQKERSDEAHAYISKFATLIRDVLKYSDKDEISLAEELQVIENYVNLERLRFDIIFSVKVDEQLDLYSVFIPPLLFQPLIENAIIHGLTPKIDDKKLTLEVRAIPDYICIIIADNGIGRNAAMQNMGGNTGKGLGFTRERLELMKEKYNIDYKMKIVDLKDSEGYPTGTKIEICISED